MVQPINHADLVARALGELSEDERLRVDTALEHDPELRRAFEEVAGHLLRYDHLPPAPPAPPFALLEARLDRALAGEPDHETAPDLRILELQDRHPAVGVGAGVRWAAVACVAAAALLLVALTVPWGVEQTADGPTLMPGPGLELVRNGRSMPAPARAAQPLYAGDVLRCTAPAEAQLGERVRLVLDAGAAVRIEEVDRPAGSPPAPTVVRLQNGRAWFEVAPGAFEVRTPYGPVRVLGTAFEVDLRAGRLDVAVAHGRVTADGREIAAGWRLAEGALTQAGYPAGGWFRQPRLQLEATAAGPATLGAPLRLRLLFSNPGQVPLRLSGPGAVRTALWASFETPDGRIVREVPIRPAHVVAGLELLEPGKTTVLGPGESKVLTIEILAPVRSAGAYRCRALYRPEGQPAVLSAPLDLEVR